MKPLGICLYFVCLVIGTIECNEDYRSRQNDPMDGFDLEDGCDDDDVDFRNQLNEFFGEFTLSKRILKRDGHCKRDGHWSHWLSWQSCSKSCGGGVRSRVRLCNNPTPKHGGSYCHGSNSNTGNCNTHPCPPVNGHWSNWHDWSICSKNCGMGTKTRVRACDNPSPANGGLNCSGSITETSQCKIKECPVNGQWSNWNSWGDCSKDCGMGTKTRVRLCDNPSPAYGGSRCSGSNTINSQCYNKACPVNGQWSNWNSWGNCSKSCGLGTKKRLRLCNNPHRAHGGLPCNGSDTEVSQCKISECPVISTIAPGSTKMVTTLLNTTTHAKNAQHADSSTASHTKSTNSAVSNTKTVASTSFKSKSTNNIVSHTKSTNASILKSTSKQSTIPNFKPKQFTTLQTKTMQTTVKNTNSTQSLLTNQNSTSASFSQTKAMQSTIFETKSSQTNAPKPNTTYIKSSQPTKPVTTQTTSGASSSILNGHVSQTTQRVSTTTLTYMKPTGTKPSSTVIKSQTTAAPTKAPIMFVWKTVAP